MPVALKISKQGSKFCKILNKPLIIAKYFLNLPKWRNFAKFGHTDHHGASFIPLPYAWTYVSVIRLSTYLSYFIRWINNLTIWHDEHDFFHFKPWSNLTIRHWPLMLRYQDAFWELYFFSKKIYYGQVAVAQLVGRTVASEARGPRFKSAEFLIQSMLTFGKTEIKKK